MELWRITFRSRKHSGIFVGLARWLRAHGYHVAWEIRPNMWPMIYYNNPKW